MAAQPGRVSRETHRRASGRSTWPTRRSPAVSSPSQSCVRAWRASACRRRRSTTPSPSSRPTGFLDDARYARQFAEDKRELDQVGHGADSARPPPARDRAAPDRGGPPGRRAATPSSDRAPAARAALPERAPQTTASATAPGRCWCAAATRRRSPTTRSARRSARSASAAAPPEPTGGRRALSPVAGPVSRG